MFHYALNTYLKLMQFLIIVNRHIVVLLQAYESSVYTELQPIHCDYPVCHTENDSFSAYDNTGHRCQCAARGGSAQLNIIENYFSPYICNDKKHFYNTFYLPL